MMYMVTPPILTSLRCKTNFDFCSLSYDIAVIQWVTSCHKNRMTTRVITLWHVYVTSLTNNVCVKNAFSDWTNIHFEDNKIPFIRVI